MQNKVCVRVCVCVYIYTHIYMNIYMTLQMGGAQEINTNNWLTFLGRKNKNSKSLHQNNCRRAKEYSFSETIKIREIYDKIYIILG